MKRQIAAPKPDPDLLQTMVAGLVPCGAAAISAYEAWVRAGEDLQRAAAREVRFGPVQYALASSAALTRDVGAAHASWIRWVLGL